MQLNTKGKAFGITDPIVGKISNQHLFEGCPTILLRDNISKAPYGFDAILQTKSILDYTNEFGPAIIGVSSLDHLNEGDIVALYPSGVVSTLYRVNSRHNFLLVTERCNSNCLMCSQPPRDRDDIELLFNIHRQLIPLIPKECLGLGITGGEPTLMGERFFHLLSLIQNHLPDTELHCLTNGRSFAWPEMTKQLGGLNYRRLMLGIPVYSDDYAVHDYVVQAKHAFEQTIQGLYLLAEQNQRIEIRVVLHKITIPRLRQLANFIFKNLPFVEHVALMGLEHTGYTPYNFDKLWIDPVDYREELQYAVEYLAGHGMNVSIYNLQLCILPETLRPFARQSISDWKNIYLSECNLCSERTNCAGFFASTEKIHSKGITPIVGTVS